VDKLESQGYNNIYLFRLEAPLDELKKRTATRPVSWNEAFTIGSWNSYQYDPNFKDFPTKIGLREVTIRTNETNVVEAAQMIFRHVRS
jgi:hypothetical protein